MSLVLAEHLLRQSGYATSCATDGESGVQLALANAANLMLCDLDLPAWDGPQLATAMRTNVAWRPVPILGLTAASLSDDERRALTANFDGCIEKPIDPPSFA